MPRRHLDHVYKEHIDIEKWREEIPPSSDCVRYLTRRPRLQPRPRQRAQYYVQCAPLIYFSMIFYCIWLRSTSSYSVLLRPTLSYSILLCSTLSYFVLLCPTLFYFVLLCSTLFYCILLHLTVSYFVWLCPTSLYLIVPHCTSSYFVLVRSTSFYLTTLLLPSFYPIYLNIPPQYSHLAHLVGACHILQLSPVSAHHRQLSGQGRRGEHGYIVFRNWLGKSRKLADTYQTGLITYI